MRRSLLLIAGLSSAGCVPAPSTSPLPQSSGSTALYMPRDVQQAYRNGTRSPDGRPGRNYWQNRARYNIAITALPPDRTIRGSEEITYFNNSPDTLANPVIRLYLNIHKPGAPRGGGASPDYLTSGVHIDTLKVNGQVVPWPGNVNTFTWRRFPLPTPLASARLGASLLQVALRHLEGERSRRDDRFDDVVPRLLLSARRGVRRLQRLGHERLHRRAGVLQRLQRLRRLDHRAGQLRRVGDGHAAQSRRGVAAGASPALHAIADRGSDDQRRLEGGDAFEVCHGAGCEEYLALPGDEHPGHDFQSEQSLRLGRGQRRRGSSNGSPSERAGGVQRHGRRLSGTW